MGGALEGRGVRVAQADKKVPRSPGARTGRQGLAQAREARPRLSVTAPWLLAASGGQERLLLARLQPAAQALAPPGSVQTGRVLGPLCPTPSVESQLGPEGPHRAPCAAAQLRWPHARREPGTGKAGRVAAPALWPLSCCLWERCVAPCPAPALHDL